MRDAPGRGHRLREVAPPKTFLDRFTDTQKAVAAASAFVLFGSLVTGFIVNAQVAQVEKQVLAVTQAGATKDAEQDKATKELDGEVEQIHDTTVELTTEVKNLREQATWTNDALWKLSLGREDLIKKPPTPTPRPTP